VLDLYDPDRLKYPVFRDAAKNISDRTAKWEDFQLWAKDNFSRLDGARGKGLAFLVQKRTSPSLDSMRERIKKRFPEAIWAAYDAVESNGVAAGSSLAFGKPMRELLTFTSGGQIKAKVIVSLDRDFLDQSEGGCLINAREFAQTRRVLKASDPMSRLYVVECGTSHTGGCADHRLRLAPSRVTAFAVALAKGPWRENDRQQVRSRRSGARGGAGGRGCGHSRGVRRGLGR
jgi:molybdopterin-containing oxidoreductase family iron-sulfur binding subunit